MNDKQIILEEIAAKEFAVTKLTGKKVIEYMHPILLIYESGDLHNRLNEVLDYIWFDILPERYKGYTIKDFYKKGKY